MKKTLLIIAVFIIIAMGVVLLAACDEQEQPQPEPPITPTLDKSSFVIRYSVDENGVAEYKLAWSASAATKFEIVFDDSEPVIFEGMNYPLSDFSADIVHTITVTAISSQNLKSEPVTVKFKGTKLTMPYNVRLYGDTNSFGWMKNNDTLAYAVSCEKLGLDMQSKPTYSGEIKTTLVHDCRLYIYDLRAIYQRLDLYSMQSFRVRALPYDGNFTNFEYSDENEVIELQLPSDFSEQSVNFYAGTMSNPENLRWNFDDFEEHSGYAYVEWDGALSNYKYSVTTKYPEGYSIGTITENGASRTNFGFGHPITNGEYEVTVQAECDTFNFVGEDTNAKWVTYIFYLQQPTTETLKFKTQQVVLDAPKNVRVEGENLVWDAVPSAYDYSVFLKNDNNDLGGATSFTPQKSLKDIAENFYAEEGEYELGIHVSSDYNKLLSMENNVPLIQLRNDANFEITDVKIKLEAIAKVQNVNVDYENKIINWDECPDAVSYTVGFKYESVSRYTNVYSATEYKFDDDDLIGCSAIIITAVGEFKVQTENGVITISIPSKYVIEITNQD